MREKSPNEVCSSPVTSLRTTKTFGSMPSSRWVSPLSTTAYRSSGHRQFRCPQRFGNLFCKKWIVPVVLAYLKQVRGYGQLRINSISPISWVAGLLQCWQICAGAFMDIIVTMFHMFLATHMDCNKIRDSWNYPLITYLSDAGSSCRSSHSKTRCGQRSCWCCHSFCFTCFFSAHSKWTFLIV